MSTIFFPRPDGRPYASDHYIPVSQIVCWYADNNGGATRVEVVGKGTITTRLSPEQIDAEYRKARKLL